MTGAQQATWPEVAEFAIMAYTVVVVVWLFKRR